MAPSMHASGRNVRSRWTTLSLLLAWSLLLAGCGESDPGVTDPDPEIAAFVGDWEAVVFNVTNLANEDQIFRVVEAGSFTLNVQPSGFYTATLLVAEFPPNVENGQLTVIGNSVRLSPTGGQATTAEYEFQGPNRIELNGPTEFDFNFDGEPEEATALIILERT